MKLVTFVAAFCLLQEQGRDTNAAINIHGDAYARDLRSSYRSGPNAIMKTLRPDLSGRSA